ncbi:MAG TPA: bifunctional DNA-formamidopyrimidine glycosylase/DNA-(apurinic or apyrimidinic site) lyase [Pirellulales bacterium]|jgi:formamidopyrimidine-DNA glycosylase|nr:bifunctional DNA-formamidopyrimidine glycosylase/DNA-(apurinic or apyrimidinic site) lyase [Pirellulales bacterium]
MPELPEVETMRRGVSGVVGSRIKQVVRPRCRLRPISVSPEMTRFRRCVVGRTIAAVDRLGKRLVLRLDSKNKRGPPPEAIVIEPRMTGLVLVAGPPDREHLRFGLELEGGAVPELWFWDRRGLGSVRLVTAAEFEARFGLDRLGPDALQISVDDLMGRLSASRREIKVALLDQRALAGIGNLYASEILHQAGVHPRRRCDKIKPRDWRRIHAATRQVLEDAILHEGSTLADGTYRNALNNAGNYQHHHRVYDRADEPCGACGTSIVRVVQAQRSTFFCPRCQPFGRQK